MKPTSILACLVALIAMNVTTSLFAADEGLSEIRKFDQATVEKLGLAIYEQDIRAARATDLLMKEKSSKKAQKEGLCGWVVEGDASDMTVLFLRKNGEAIEAYYSVRFLPEKTPVLEKCTNPALTEHQKVLYAARTLAGENIARPCSRSYNFVMLPDPEKEGILVYALAATNKANEILVGGHYRFTISKDGKTIERTDAFTRSCLTLNKPQGKQSGGQVVALYMTTLVDDKPQEIHVFLSLLHKLPFAVMTPDSSIWEVKGAKMEQMAGK